MAKILMLIAQTGFRDEELNVPLNILKKAGHSIMVASETRTKAKGSRGAEVMPDVGFHEANPEFFNAVIVVGGPGSPKLAENKDVIRIIQAMNAKNKIIAAICLGPMALAKANVLVSRKATVFRTSESVALLRKNGAIVVQEPVVIDGNIITANGPEAAEEFGNALAKALA